MLPKVTIVVLNYKNYEDTIACLCSLAEISYPNAEIIVVDNDSQNNSIEHIHQNLLDRQLFHVVIEESAIDISGKIPQKTILLQSASNRGYAAGNNLGIRLALVRCADYVLILNNDTLVEKGFLEPLVQYADAHEKVGAVGPKVLLVDGHIESSCARRRPTLIGFFLMAGIGQKLMPNNRWIRRHIYQGEYKFDHPNEVDLLSGCCMLIKCSAFNRIGLLDENTFLFLEELILHEKFRAVGLVSTVVPDSVIIHKHGQSRGTVPSEFVNNAGFESLRYYLKHYRYCNRLTVALIMFSCNPKTFLRKLLKFQ